MFSVIHQNWQGDNRFVGKFSTKEEANKAISADLKQREIKPYYIRIWECRDKVEQIDYGSHSEFYYIEMEV